MLQEIMQQNSRNYGGPECSLGSAGWRDHIGSVEHWSSSSNFLILSKILVLTFKALNNLGCETFFSHTNLLDRFKPNTTWDREQMPPPFLTAAMSHMALSNSLLNMQGREGRSWRAMVGDNPFLCALSLLTCHLLAHLLWKWTDKGDRHMPLVSCNT